MLGSEAGIDSAAVLSPMWARDLFAAIAPWSSTTRYRHAHEYRRHCSVHLSHSSFRPGPHGKADAVGHYRDQ